MGVDISIWRARIGVFTQPCKGPGFEPSAIATGELTRYRLSLSVLVLFNLLLLCSGLEPNPGPSKAACKCKCESVIADLDKLKITVESLVAENRMLCEKIRKMEDQSRRENVVLYGIPEKKKEDGPETWAETEEAVRKVFKEKRKMDVADSNVTLPIERAHRLPGKGNAEARPVIVKFRSFKDRDMVWKSAKEKLRYSDVKMAEDFSQETRSIRRRLGTYLKEARDGGYRAFMKYDKVEIDKLSYELDEPSGLLKRNKTLFTYDVASQQIREVDKGDSGE